MSIERLDAFEASTLISTVVCHLMPETDVSEKRKLNYEQGAYIFLEHLANGDLCDLTEHEKNCTAVLLGRIVTNAERNGI